MDIGVARILSGVHFFPKKLTLTTFFSVVALKDCLNLPQNHLAKTVLKLTLALAGGGVHFVSWEVHLHIFPVN